MIIADWRDIEIDVASEVHVKRLKSKDVGIKKLQELFVVPCADGSLRQEGHAQHQTLRHQRVEGMDAGGVPSTLGEAMGDPVQSVKGDSLQEEGGVADFSGADRDAVEAREDFWRMAGEFTCRNHVVPSEIVCVPKEPSVPIPLEYTNVVRQTSTDLDNLQESSIDDFWNIDGNIMLSESWRRIHEIPHPEQDDRLTNTQVISRPETIWREVRSSVSKCAQQKAKQQWDIEKTHHSSCTSEEETLRYSHRRS